VSIHKIEPMDLSIEKCKEKIENIPCHLAKTACQKGKIILWEKCIQSYLYEKDQLNTFSNISSCSTEKGGGVTI